MKKLIFNTIVLFLYLLLLKTELNSRNPFLLKNIQKSESRTIVKRNSNINVLGLLTSLKKKGCILQKGKEQIVVFSGERAWEYKVTNILNNEIVLLADSNEKISLYFEN